MTGFAEVVNCIRVEAVVASDYADILHLRQVRKACRHCAGQAGRGRVATVALRQTADASSLAQIKPQVARCAPEVLVAPDAFLTEKSGPSILQGRPQK